MPSNADDFARKIRQRTEQLAANIQAISETKQLPAADSLSPAFMAANTPFPTVEAMLQAGPEPPRTLEAFAAMAGEQRDAFVAAHTPFPTWHALQIAAAKAWAGARFTRGL